MFTSREHACSRAHACSRNTAADSHRRAAEFRFQLRPDRGGNTRYTICKTSGLSLTHFPEEGEEIRHCHDKWRIIRSQSHFLVLHMWFIESGQLLACGCCSGSGVHGLGGTRSRY